MKKLTILILSIIMMVSFAACSSSGGKTEPIIPGGDLNTLNKIFENGYESSGTMISDNVYAQTVTNEKDEEYILIVKVPAELMADFESIDFLSEDAELQYLSLIGDIELTESVNTADLIPDQDSLDAYKGMTISEFEMTGAELNGYVGADGKYEFFFNDDRCDYRVELEDGVKLEDYEDTDMFDAAISDLKIEKLECLGLSDIFVQSYIEQFLDPLEKAVPRELGDAAADLDEINAAVGSEIKPTAGASEETFSVIDGKIAQYTYLMDDYYYCIRSAADTDINLADDDFAADPLVDEDGYVTIVNSQNDETQSLRFVFDGYQYAYIVYGNGELDYETFSGLSGEFKDSVCVYKDGSALTSLLTGRSSDDGYIMSGIPVSGDTVQLTAYTFDDTQTKLWTMLVKESGGQLIYDDSKFELYLRDGGEDPAPSSAGAGKIAVNGDTIIWNDRVFK